MPGQGPLPVRVEPVAARDDAVTDLLNRLTAELAHGGYTAEQTFGYSVDQLEAACVHLVGAFADGRLVGVAGIERQDEDTAELKRFYVAPACRGRGVADALLAALIGYAREHRLGRVRLETGDKQSAAIAFYRRNGFVEVPAFGPYVGSATSVCMQRAVDVQPLS